MIAIQGLQICKQYYYEIAHDSLKQRFADIFDRLAVGLVGAGSDCFGFDDEISRDHDWGPGFCIFVPGDIYTDAAPKLSAWYDGLAKTYAGHGPRFVTEPGRIGPLHLENFFATLTGLRCQSPSLRQWLAANAEGLALCANGELFFDNAGLFTSWREALSKYPEDVRRKKIASDCFLAGQSGQYNYIRSTKRGDAFAAEYALTQFCSRALSLAFLLANQFAPYYKWKLKAALLLPPPYADIARGVADILENRENTQARIEALSQEIIAQLKLQGLAKDDSDFLADYKDIVEKTIVDDDIRSLPGLY